MAENAHVCKFCHRRFGRGEHLRRHLSTHTDEKPFRCHCGKSFSRKDLLKRHEQIGKHLDLTMSSSAASSLATPASIDENTPSQSFVSLNTPAPIVGDYTGTTRLSDTSTQLEPSAAFSLFDSDLFHDFDSFISTMGLNMPFQPDLFVGGMNDDLTPAPPRHADVAMLHRHPNGPRIHQSYQCQYVASGIAHADFATADADELQELRPMPCPWNFTCAERDEFQVVTASYESGTETLKIPSRLALGRYMAAYFDECYHYFPIIHAATFQPQRECVTSPELVLAMLASGAMTKFETGMAVRLWYAAKKITLDKWSKRSHETNSTVVSKLRCAQAALLLVDYAMLHSNLDATQSSSELREVLLDYVRHDSRSAQQYTDTDWKNWILAEGIRRTICCTFDLLTLQSIIFDAPPSLLVGELNVRLPTSTTQWTACSEQSWKDARTLDTPPLSLQEAFQALFSALTSSHSHSPLANMVLMDAMLQRIYLSRQMQLAGTSAPMSSGFIGEMQTALRCWTNAWQQAKESMLDPRNPDGSNSFTSTAYLGLAYIRLCTPYASQRSLGTWDPEAIANSLYAASLPVRSSAMAPALLHATQALYIPVKLGLDWVSRSHFLHWNKSVFIYYLEAAVFLSKWLLSVAQSSGELPVTDCEVNVMSTLQRLVDDVDESLDPLYETCEEQTSPNLAQGNVAGHARQLAVRIAQIWARLFRHHNSPWPTVELIGKSLDAFASLLCKNMNTQDITNVAY